MTYLQRYFYKVPEANRTVGAIAFYAGLDSVAAVAPSVAVAVADELRDQMSHVKLIASENYSSLAVQQAMGNLLTDKYAEGYPFHRFYAGCENVDVIEAEAVNELKILFGCDHAYVQPHSGADANLVAFWAILTQRVQNAELEKMGGKKLDEISDEEHERIRQLMCNQKVMGMSLDSGGHLTHGYRHNLSSKMMKASHYHVDPTSGLLDYDQIARAAREVKPDILLAGYSAYPRRVNFAKMREIADEVGAVFMVDMAHFAGLVAGKVFTGDEDPIPHAHIVTSTTHKTLRGPRGGMILCTNEYKDIVNRGCPLALGGPLPHVLAAKTVAFKEANSYTFPAYAQAICDNAQAMAEAFAEVGASLTTGGTDNHLMVVDVRPYGITGRQAETALREAGLTCNRNALPGDPNGAWYTSGIRLGTPATTTLGMDAIAMKKIAQLIDGVLKTTTPATAKNGKQSKAKYTIDQAVLEQTRAEVKELMDTYPLYPELVVDRKQTKEEINA